MDSDGDGVGDLAGLISKLDYIASLKVDAIWLSPVYPSPNADYGYDVSDYCDVDPQYGSLAVFDHLVEDAHARGLRVVLDYVPCHSSIEHPWFRQYPDRYIWTDKPNNWQAFFGGSAWTLDPVSGRYYLHSFFREQPDLNWRNPDVVAAMQDVLRFWRARGVDGFRIDAICRLLKDEHFRDNPPAREQTFLPAHESYAAYDPIYSCNHPDIGTLLAKLREAAGDMFLVAETGVPTAGLAPYLAHFDAAFCFEFLLSAWDPRKLRCAIEAGIALEAERGTVAWVFSNHDIPRISSRVGRKFERLALTLLLTLPGTSFVYAGDELGLLDGPGAAPPLDRHGRDGARHPIAWNTGPGGGFTTGVPWLPVSNPHDRNVAGCEADPNSILQYFRKLMHVRAEFDGPLEFVDLGEDVLAYRRGAHLIVHNFGAVPLTVREGKPVLTGGTDQGTAVVAPHSSGIFQLT